MSRIGRKPIPLPNGVTVAIAEGIITVQGPKGTLSRAIPAPITVRRDAEVLYVERPDDVKAHKALHGLTRSLVANMVDGVATGFTRQMSLHGIGYRAQLQGDRVVLNLGFSHDVIVIPPSGITIAVETVSPNVDNQHCTARLTVSGISKEKVGQVAAKIRALKKPEPYKGKGLRFAGEVVRRKAGKAAKAGKGKK
ncbi:MAG TPA: 50S ribosomal protein L6 [Armatimonadota bacterium]|nr:50S ribosomal protein L6 [Armatimonadota bacterium]HOS44075.1 50S ribosomal protein L6 [Armatimonadota bacterium]